MTSADLLQIVNERLRLKEPLKEILVADAEFKPIPGELPIPVCFTFKELISGKFRTLWLDELAQLSEAPFSTESDTLFLSFNLIAEFLVMRRLGWQLPRTAIDLMIEFRCLTNGKEHRLPTGEFVKLYSLVDALKYFEVREIDVTHKEKMQRLALDTELWTPELRASLTEYNCQDVIDHEQLFHSIVEKIDYPRALLRGQYSHSLALIEERGLSVDGKYLQSFFRNRDSIIQNLIAEIDEDYKVFDNGRFRENLFSAYLERESLLELWPKTATGRPKTDKETFKDFGDAFPKLKKLATLLSTKKNTAHRGIPVGSDGRNRFSFRPFMTKTGRNATRPSECLPACPGWMRGFITPPKGKVLIQSDWEQQEIGIAAALSGDPKMLEAYRSGDPYLALGKQAGAIPVTGTKESHAAQRNLFKQCSLGVLFGMGADELGRRIGDANKAKELVSQHRSTYPIFWEWRQAAIDLAYVQGHLDAILGWRIHVTEHTKPTTIGNFPMQANGAEMMRVATIMAEQAGLKIVAILHDAFLIECDEFDEQRHSKLLIDVMREASISVLGSLELRSDLKAVKYPDRFIPKDKQEFWNLVSSLIDKAATDIHSPRQPRPTVLSI